MPKAVIRSLLVLGAACAVVVSATGGVDALQQGSFSVSRASPKQNKAFGPIPGSNPSLTHTPSDCRSGAYCDEIDLHVDTSAFAADDQYQVALTLTYDSTADTLEIYVYDKSGTRLAANTSGVSPQKTSVDHPYSGPYSIVINNFAGPAPGYTVAVELQYLGKQKSIPKFQDPTSNGPRFTPLPPLPVTKPAPVNPPFQNLAPAATLAPVLTPGPDGSLGTYALDSVPTKAEAARGGPAWWAILSFAMLLLVVLGGGGWIVVRRFQARAT